MTFGISNTNECCWNCEYYVRHYARLPGSLPAVHMNGFTPIFCGHCKHGRLKSRKATDICDRFQRAEDTRQGA